MPPDFCALCINEIVPFREEIPDQRPLNYSKTFCFLLAWTSDKGSSPNNALTALSIFQMLH